MSRVSLTNRTSRVESSRVSRVTRVEEQGSSESSLLSSTYVGTSFGAIFDLRFILLLYRSGFATHHSTHCVVCVCVCMCSTFSLHIHTHTLASRPWSTHVSTLVYRNPEGYTHTMLVPNILFPILALGPKNKVNLPIECYTRLHTSESSESHWQATHTFVNELATQLHTQEEFAISRTTHYTYMYTYVQFIVCSEP
jgi:hypothetical protein